MSTVPAAVSVPARAPRTPSRRIARAGRPAKAGMLRRRPSSAIETTPDTVSAQRLSAWLVPALLAVAMLAAFSVLCLPALRAQLAIGWLPLWLMLAPLSAAAALATTRGVSDRSRVPHR